MANSAYAQENTTEKTVASIAETADSLVVQLTPIETRSNLNLADSRTETTTSDTTSTLEQINLYTNQVNSDSIGQVTNVSELRDVSPGDWAYEAIRSLVERYGCLPAYSDGTYRGNRALTRYEFATGLNACLNQIERLIASGMTDIVSRQDLEMLQRLIQEFQPELTALDARVDKLEGRVALLEQQQFSTTTKLRGEVIFSFAGAFGEERAIGGRNTPDTFNNDLDENIVFQDRVRLFFDTSFTGKDRLRTRFQMGNANPNFAAVTGSEMARINYDAGDGNDVVLEKLYYFFRVGNNLQFHIITTGADFDDIATSVANPFFEDSATGALSRFLRYNPAVYRTGADQALGVNIKFSNALSLDLGYLTGNAASPLDKDGLFNGDYTAAAQLSLKLGNSVDLAFTYAHSYYPGTDVNLSGSTGNDLAKQPFVNFDNNGNLIGVATSANRFGLQASAMLGSTMNISAWVGYIDAKAESGPSEGAEAKIWTGAVNLSFLDVGKKGALLGIGAGIPPKLTDIKGDSLTVEDKDTSYLVEVQYRYPISDNILVTPGVIAIFNPNHNNANDTIYVGVIRTVFSF